MGLQLWMNNVSPLALQTNENSLILTPSSSSTTLRIASDRLPAASRSTANAVLLRGTTAAGTLNFVPTDPFFLPSCFSSFPASDFNAEVRFRRRVGNRRRKTTAFNTTNKLLNDRNEKSALMRSLTPDFNGSTAIVFSSGLQNFKIHEIRQWYFEKFWEKNILKLIKEMFWNLDSGGYNYNHCSWWTKIINREKPNQNEKNRNKNILETLICLQIFQIITLLRPYMTVENWKFKLLPIPEPIQNSYHNP